MDIAIVESGVLLKLRFIHFHQDKIQYDTHKSTVSCVRTSLKFCRGKYRGPAQIGFPKYIYFVRMYGEGGRVYQQMYACVFRGREGQNFCVFLRT